MPLTRELLWFLALTAALTKVGGRTAEEIEHHGYRINGASSSRSNRSIERRTLYSKSKATDKSKTSKSHRHSKTSKSSSTNSRSKSQGVGGYSTADAEGDDYAGQHGGEVGYSTAEGDDYDRLYKTTPFPTTAGAPVATSSPTKIPTFAPIVTPFPFYDLGPTIVPTLRPTETPSISTKPTITTLPSTETPVPTPATYTPTFPGTPTVGFETVLCDRQDKIRCCAENPPAGVSPPQYCRDFGCDIRHCPPSTTRRG